MSIALWLHVLGVVVWVGGMFFAHVALRPSVQALEPPVRLPLLAATLRRFFAWVAVAVLAILVTGVWMIVRMGGFAAAGPSVHAMSAVGSVMAAIYGYIVMVPFRAMRTAVAARTWPAAGAAMARIRTLVALNLVLGVVAISVAMLGRSA